MYDYSLQEFGYKRAEQYIQDLANTFQKLADDPTLGQNYDFVRSGLFIYRIVSHVIFYKRSPVGIIIIRVLHKSMDYKRHLS